MIKKQNSLRFLKVGLVTNRSTTTTCFSASRFGRPAYNLPIDSRCTATGYWFQRVGPISILTSTSPWIKQLETSWNIYKYYAHIMFAHLSNDCWTWPSFTTQKINKKTINNSHIIHIHRNIKNNLFQKLCIIFQTTKAWPSHLHRLEHAPSASKRCGGGWKLGTIKRNILRNEEKTRRNKGDETIQESEAVEF